MSLAIVLFVSLVCGVTLQGQTFVSPLTSVSASHSIDLNRTFPLIEQSFSDLCRGVVVLASNQSALGAVAFVKHQKGDSLLVKSLLQL